MSDQTDARIRKSPRYRLFIGPAILAAIAILGIAYGNYKFFREVPQVICGDVEEVNRAALCASDAEEMFKYGSLGAEAERGVPYPLFHVLPRVFGDLLPGPGGYRAFGLAWEEGRELPVGFAKKTLGFPRITQNCAVCHASTYRVSATAKPAPASASGPGSRRQPMAAAPTMAIASGSTRPCVLLDNASMDGGRMSPSGIRQRGLSSTHANTASAARLAARRCTA